MSFQPFHLAITVNDLVAAEDFYAKLLGCPMGRRSDGWIDFNLYGHQLVCHLTDQHTAPELPANSVDGQQVPVPHFGVVLTWAEWEVLAARLMAAKIRFIIEPTVRFAGQIGEQATMFFPDPAGNMLEFKAMRDPEQLFAV
jgi:extradiol dioxygenase family protein